MTPEEMRELALELFKKRMHCSQAVALAGLAHEGIEAPELIQGLGAFGGGIASQGATCGCLTGAIAMVSMLYSRPGPDHKESPDMWRGAFKMVKAFNKLTEEFGSMDCREIAGVNWRDRDEVKEFYRNPTSRRQHCVRLVGDTAQALGEYLAQRPEWDGPDK